MSRLISIIIPTYNPDLALFQEVLTSIYKQTYRPIEVVIVDDGSEDIQKYFDKLSTSLRNEEMKGVLGDLNVIVHRQENKGAPAARNKGFELSKGEYVIFWDDDCIGEPDMLEKMYMALEEHPEASYAYAHMYFGNKKMPGMAFDAEKLKKTNYIHSTSLIRREDVVKWDENLKKFQDWDLWLTMLEEGKTGVLVPEYLFRIKPKRGGMSQWLPSCAYTFPWKLLPGIRKRVKKYEEAREILMEKHGLK